MQYLASRYKFGFGDETDDQRRLIEKDNGYIIECHSITVKEYEEFWIAVSIATGLATAVCGQDAKSLTSRSGVGDDPDAESGAEGGFL